MFLALKPGALPARERSPGELYEWVRRDEEYAILGDNVMVELYSEATPADHHPPGRSPAAPSLPTGASATATAELSAATPTVRAGLNVAVDHIRSLPTGEMAPGAR